MKIDLYASERHFVDHLAAVLAALPRSRRGDLVVAGGSARNESVTEAARAHALELGLRPVPAFSTDRRPVLVAAYGDMKQVRTAGRGPIALIEHGIGQSYSNTHPSFPGGTDREDIALLLSPNATAAARDRARYPAKRIEVIGSPRLDQLEHRQGAGRAVIAVSSHWDCAVAPESRSALFRPRPGFAGAIAKLAERYQVIGHGHPRAWPIYEPWYRGHGIEPVEDLAEVFRRADVYVCDNSSSMFEFAATGRPVVVLNSRIYRRRVRHGLRFWDAANVGVQVDHAVGLADGVAAALEDDSTTRARREAALDIVYAYRSGAAQRAADALLDWADGLALRARHAPAAGPGPQHDLARWSVAPPPSTSTGLVNVAITPAHHTIVRIAGRRRTA